MDVVTDWGPRGKCPVCGSRRVTHIVLGMPRPGEVETAPEWVEFAGCIVTSDDDRACDACGRRWVSDDDQLG
jgi:RNA polymerase subunit RPABC4/transcription elongation factor Spt4